MAKKGTYDPEDIIKVLDDKLIKTTTVKERLNKLNRKYKNIHPDYLKRMLKGLLGDDKIGGGKDLETGFYFWKRRE